MGCYGSNMKWTIRRSALSIALDFSRLASFATIAALIASFCLVMISNYFPTRSSTSSPAWSNFLLSWRTWLNKLPLNATESWSWKVSLQYDCSYNWVIVPKKHPWRKFLEILRHYSLCIVFICCSRLARALLRALFFCLMRWVSRLTSCYHDSDAASCLFWYSVLNFLISSSSVSSSTSRIACSTVLVSNTFKIGWTSLS